MLTQGNRLPLPSPFLPWCPRASGHPHTELSSCLTSLLGLYSCLSPKEKTLEQFFQRGESGHSRMSFSSGSINISTKESAASGHLCKSLAPNPFLQLALVITFHHHPHTFFQGARLGCSHSRQKRVWVCGANLSSRCLDLPCYGASPKA